MVNDLCPVATMYASVNIRNHMTCIGLANLGPADPREPNFDYWNKKMQKWGVPEGAARSRLCMNCEHYEDTLENQECISKGPGGSVKASELLIEPKWVDIEGMPAAICSRWGITCSALRTCDDWEPVRNMMEEMNGSD